MISKLLHKFYVTLMVILSIGCMAACSAFTPTAGPLTTPTPPGCQPSQIQTSKNDFPEIQGTMHSDGEVWALLFFNKGHAKEDLKLVWRITGSDDQFTVAAKLEDGTVISPIWGPDDHGGSSWHRPGHEWGTGFNFPKPGCWTLTATRGSVIGEIRLDIVAPE